MNVCENTIDSNPWGPIMAKFGELIQNFLDDKISARVCAERLTDQALDEDETELSTKVFILWGSIRNVATNPRTVTMVVNGRPIQESMIELLDQISKIDTKNNGQQLMVYDMPLWQDLPLFTWSLRDNYNYLDLPSSDPKQAEHREKWINLSTFTAYLFRHQPDRYGFYAIATIKECLECAPWCNPNVAAEIERLKEELAEIGDGPGAEFHKDNYEEYVYNSTAEKLDVWVPAAAQWFEIAGEQLYKRSKIGDNHFRCRSGELWKGSDGFSLERWELWIERFGQIAEMDEISEQTSKIARAMARKLEELKT